MTGHKRTAIRNAIKTALMNETQAADRIVMNRAIPLFGIELPAINIYTLEETNEPDSIQDAPTMRNLTLAIDIYAEANEDVDLMLDEIAKEVEDILAEPYALGDDVIHTILQSTVFDLNQIGDHLCGICRLTYEVNYIA